MEKPRKGSATYWKQRWLDAIRCYAHALDHETCDCLAEEDGVIP